MNIVPTNPTPIARAGRLTVCAAFFLLAGCSILDPKPKDASTIYAPDPRVQADASWPSVQWPLSLTRPNATRMIDSQRILVRPSSNELQVYKGSVWAKPPGEMLEDALLRALEDSGRIPAVTRQGTGAGVDYRLVLDLRRFESVYANGNTPAATIEVTAKLLHVRDEQIVATRTFLQAQPATSTAVADVVNAFEQSLATVSRDLAGWVLASGESHERSVHRKQDGTR